MIATTDLAQRVKLKLFGLENVALGIQKIGEREVDLYSFPLILVKFMAL